MYLGGGGGGTSFLLCNTAAAVAAGAVDDAFDAALPSVVSLLPMTSDSRCGGGGMAPILFFIGIFLG